VKVPGSWPNLKPEENRFVTPEPVKIRVVQTSVPRPQPGGEDTVMVMHELDQPRPTYVLKRGQYDNPDKSEPLKPAVPEVLDNWNEDWPRNRLGLAYWLTDPQHPLTARVTVNRMWQHHFGTGLVKTSENFGVQGEHPSHPELLDYLARRFVDGGWDVKAMHRLIVTSATYRQSARVTDRLKERDPENRLLARGPRKRLSPFALRDSILLASGLLNEHIGGPSVKPYMPPAIWSSISNAKYKRDSGGKLYRRSMYTYWRRTVPPPTMMAFNAAARETCIVRTDQTTTPLQALTLMNNVAFVEASRSLADRVLQLDELTPRLQIRRMFRSVTSRRPEAGELNLLVDDFRAYRAEFRDNPEAARRLIRIGESPWSNQVDAIDLAAMTLVANTVLNLDEAIMEN
jgi:hypothetical protein